MALADFENLLKKSIGLDVASIGGAAVSRAVQQRQSACDLKDVQAYWERARGSETELQELIEAVVVPETWFFRDRPAFTALAHFVTGEWTPSRTGNPLRVLSLPSSTGEEPYSIAMVLLDAGVAPDSFRIDAVDVSARAVAQAQHAVYRKNSFRSADLAFRARHFDETPSGYRLTERVRQQVHFKQGNLFSADVLLGGTIYDFVFCRNLLIYFDRSTQDSAIGVIEHLLAPSGVLFVAPSESALLVCHDYVSMKVPMASAFRKGRCPQRPPPPRSVQPRTLNSAAPQHSDKDRPPEANAVRLDASAGLGDVSAWSANTKAGFDEAARLADEGRFSEAAFKCEEHMKRSGPSAEAFHLLGLIRDASGDVSDAASCYRKALYLDPHHQEVLLHLAMLMEKQNKAADARILRNRALRAREKSRG